jgi:hypothetical protein
MALKIVFIDPPEIIPGILKVDIRPKPDIEFAGILGLIPSPRRTPSIPELVFQLKAFMP